MVERKGFNAEISDANAENLSSEKIIQKAREFDKIFITTSTLDKWQCYEPNIQSCIELIKQIQKINSNVFLIGAHGTMKPNDLQKLTNVKAVIRGEPELTILDICNDKNLKDVKGITYKKNGKIVSNSDREPLDLNKLALPAFHLLPMNKYYYEIMGNDFTLFESSRGCPFSCTYCFKSMYGKERRQKSLDKITEEVRYGIEKFGIKNAYFIDLEFCLNKKLVESLCDFLIKEKYDFNWTCQTRFDTIDADLLKKMKKAGCSIIHFGVESGSQKILDKINKKLTIQQIKKGMKLVKKSNIKTVCFFMFGLPTETKTDIDMTIKLAKELNPTYASFHIAVPYLGTQFYEEIKSELDERGLFPLAYGNQKELEKIKKKAYRKFYLRPGYVFSRISQGELKLLIKQLKLYSNSIKNEGVD